MNNIKNPPEWKNYWEEISPHLLGFIDSQKDLDVYNYLVNTYAFYLYYTEDIYKKIKKNDEYYATLSLFLVFMHDYLRSIIKLYESFHIGPLALVQRTVFETYCNFKYMTESNNYNELISKYERFADVEKILMFRDNPKLKLSEDEIREIKKHCPEWFKTKSNGEMFIIKNWTANNEMSLKKRAQHCGLEKDYNVMYSSTSKFIHASPLTRNVYLAQHGLTPLVDKKNIFSVSIVTSNYALDFLRSFMTFFGVAFPEKEHTPLSDDFLYLMKKYKISASS
ncbi:MAG: DUF5677 domain-containing protein [Proteobacteria bacterium]|nr:DUF5677 domain-containing protein [Pseudomonadota bacterium]